jgi:hypothetical protein
VVSVWHADGGDAFTIMPHASLRLVPGVNSNETPALNENSGISSSSLIRFFYDPNGIALVQPIGGWTKYFPTPMVSTVRALWAWEDLNLEAHLAVGTVTVPTTTSAQLAVITNGTLDDVTPTLLADSIAPVVSATAGSATIEITDSTVTGITEYNSVYITTQISIGGVILFGLYACDPDGFLSSNTYTVFSIDQLGNLLPAVATSSSPVLPTFTTVNNSPTVTVTLPGYTYAVGDTFPILVATTVGGITLYGNYVVQSTPGVFGEAAATFTGSSAVIGATNTFAVGQQVIFVNSGGALPTGISANTQYFVIATGLSGTQFEVSLTPGGAAVVPSTAGTGTQYVVFSASTFTILADIPATSAATATLNGGNAEFIYSFGQGTLPGGTGYGAGYYGQGGYGTGTAVTPSTGAEIDAIDWTLDNWGETLIACPVRDQAYGVPQFQPIYQWNVITGAATIITNAPPVNDGVFVAMPQRQLIAWGSTQTGIQDPLLISWCDVGNYNQWIALVTNQAGSYRIPTGSHIVTAAQGPQQGVVLTDIDAWSMQYIGPPYVYSFNKIGTGCGGISRKCLAFLNGIGYWMGPAQFYSLSSEGVQPVPCSVWDVVYQNLNTAIDPNTGVSNTAKIRVAVNSRFGEIQWFYPSANGTGEVDSYVKFNAFLGVWDYGALGRTAWVDQSVLGPPIGADPSSLYLYQHETSNDADGVALTPYFQSGYYAIAEGDVKAFVDWIWPDMKWGFYDAAQSGTVQISFLCADYPGQTPTVYGPYTVTQATEYFYTRFRARLMAVKISSDTLGTWWRIGNIRYRFAPDGQI